MGSLLISKEIEIDYGHCLKEHLGKCYHFHGHRAKVVAWFQGKSGDGGKESVIINDSSRLKRVMMKHIHDILDHNFIIQRTDDRSDIFDEEVFADTNVQKFDFAPTAENLARWCFEQLKHWFEMYEEDVEVVRVDFFETPTSMASYGE